MQAVLRIENLPEEALEAAALFYAEHVPQIRGALAEGVTSLVIVVPAAARDHAAWRRAAAQDLAREAAPKRVNIISGGSGAGLAATIAWLEAAPGVTGQLLPVAHTSDGTAS